MPRKISDKQNIRKISRIGPRSLGVILPAELIDDLGWREKQRVVVKKDRARLIITDWRSPAKRKPKARAK